MNQRSKRLQPAADQAHQKAEDALAKLAMQQQALAKAEHQLDELERYRREYAEAGNGPVSVTALLNRQQFVARKSRLTEALALAQPMTNLLVKDSLDWVGSVDSVQAFHACRGGDRGCAPGAPTEWCRQGA